MDKTFEYVGEYYQECDRRNRMTKAELAQERPWILLIDECAGIAVISFNGCFK